jgi:hypothetical protein
LRATRFKSGELVSVAKTLVRTRQAELRFTHRDGTE